MQSSIRMSAVLRGLLPLLFLAGCNTYHPYGRYPGAYSYPQNGYPYQQQYPNNSIAPNNGDLGRSGAIQGNQGAGSGADAGGMGANKGPAASRDFPRNEANRGSAGQFPSEKTVPNYNDPNKIDGTDSKGDFGAGSQFPEKKQESVSPFGSRTETRSQPAEKIQLTNSRQFPSVKDDRFRPPRSIDTDAQAQPIAPATENAAAPNPYAYDAKSYSWLRGKVDYDEVSKTWQIIYSKNPNENDQYGGSMTLVDHPRLKDFRNDDVAYIEGEIDTSGGLGKPRYKIAFVKHPLAPTTKSQASKVEAGPAFTGGTEKPAAGDEAPPFNNGKKSPF